MGDPLPLFFAALAGLALLGALWALWGSLRHAFSGSSPEDAGGSSDEVMHSPERAELLQRKESLLLSLQDLKADYEAGKISESDHARIERDLRQQARQVLRQLDEELGPFKARARELIAQHVQSMPARATAPAKDAPRLCSKCETPNDPDAAFCKKCGGTLEGGSKESAEDVSAEDVSSKGSGGA